MPHALGGSGCPWGCPVSSPTAPTSAASFWEPGQRGKYPALPNVCPCYTHLGSPQRQAQPQQTLAQPQQHRCKAFCIHHCKAKRNLRKYRAGTRCDQKHTDLKAHRVWRFSRGCQKLMAGGRAPLAPVKAVPLPVSTQVHQSTVLCSAHAEKFQESWEKKQTSQLPALCSSNTSCSAPLCFLKSYFLRLSAGMDL